MALSLIVAHDKNNGIGYKNTIPWYIPDDFKYFKKITTDKTVVMGSKTYYSIPEKFRPLPNRENFVLCNNSDNHSLIKDECGNFFTSIEDVIKYSESRDVFIIGGASVYEQFIGYVDFLYITKIEKVFECDTYFPIVNYSEWVLGYSIEKEQDDFTYSFNYYSKINRV